ncbi:histidine kinase [Rhodococcus ruber]|uniref:histidine kinase n=1 Tax=Rhodococcus ruber TaxID=1830 RepID=A0ABT4MJI8_9NOCA|nr:histidine kinase [Rhodococcus ruber]MCZ4521153.1 histidine kinase [Rhodococcus ruber]
MSTRTLLAMAVTGLLATPISIAATDIDLGTGYTGALAAVGLIALGVGLPIVSSALARADWASAAAVSTRPPTSRPEVVLREPKTIIRPLAYSVVMVTIGGAVAVTLLLSVIGSVVAVFSPYLAVNGDSAVIGPVTITTLPQGLVAATAGSFVLGLLVWASPLLVRRHVRFVEQVLTLPEQRLRHDLTATAQSRARIVRSFDVERRRIERDVHDAVQPQLLSVSMSLGLALAELPADTPGRDDIVRAQHQAHRSLADLRRVVRNIYPQVLIDHGLGAAVREIADNFAISVSVNDRLGRRLPPDIEANLYFCVSELLSNIVKHSTARRAEVVLRTMQGNEILVSVHDEGCGGASARSNGDGGLSGISDRLAAVDGTISIDSPVGGPTDITIVVCAA